LGEQADRVRRTVDFLRSRGFGDADAAFVLGSGLASAVALDVAAELPFEEIPGFPRGSVPGHPRRLEYGSLAGVRCLVVRGRVHYYEGVDLLAATFPVRVSRALGARWIGLTNACGALRPGYDVGDVVVIADHLNLLGESPLAGPNDDELGTRFPDLSAAYDRELAERAEGAIRRAGWPVRRGVYAAVAGPQFETPAELRMLRRTLGADLVGMSTVPETIVAVHAKLRVLALSVVTDLAYPDAPVLRLARSSREGGRSVGAARGADPGRSSRRQAVKSEARAARPVYELGGVLAPAREAEPRMLSMWQQRDVFRKSMAQTATGKPFVFFEGPPTANGRPGVHHVLARTVKDLVCRYQTMRGRWVLRRGGWDTHGLPVELEVEKRLGIANKREIVEKLGIEEFNKQCRESVFTYLEEWRRLTERIGYWVDLQDEYVTLKNDYIESVWALLKTIHDRGLLYRDFKTVAYSTRSGTTLSDHEIALGYREVDDPSVFLRFRWEDDPSTSFLVWTTTPWTLPGNAAIAVHPDVEYVKVRVGEEHLVLAEPLRGAVLGADTEVVQRWQGRELAGRRYAPLFDFFAAERRAHPAAWTVIAEPFVTTTDGTGLVHIAPAFGADDLDAGRRHDLPRLLYVDDAGVLTKEVGAFAGRWFKDADKPITRDLKERGLLFRQTTYKHTYPFNWRGDDPLMYVAREAWYLRTTAIKDRLVELNAQIRWVPDHIRDGRFGDWLANNVDWALSRERFWGTPLPIWVSDRSKDRVEVIGSVAELSEKAGRDLRSLDLHRPYVDQITWPDGEGGTMRRIPEVLDVWFDSGAMPFAQWHWPFEHRERSEQQFPADFICEGLDQTRGWFYSLHAIAALVKNDVAYRSCFVTGLLLAEDGRKMSKSLGNTVDPWKAVEIGGADALRWFLTVSNNPSGAMRFSADGVIEASRKILDTLRNLYQFFARYANIDGWTPEVAAGGASGALLDRWVLSRLSSVIAAATRDLEAPRSPRGTRDRGVRDRRPVELVRALARAKGSGRRAWRRTSAPRMGRARLPDASARLVAPFAPFRRRAVRARRRREGAESVHLATWPVPDASLVDSALERQMDDVRRLVRLGRAARQRANVKTRQPLARMKIVHPAGGDRSGLFDIVLDELNVKRLEIGDPSELRLSAKARFDVLGPRFGKDVKVVAAAIAKLDVAQVSGLERKGEIEVEASGTRHVVRREEVVIAHEDPPGWIMEREAGWSVALDLAIDDELRDEGFAREIINKIQFMRKKADFDVTDRIEVWFEGTDVLRGALERYGDLIRGETQAERITTGKGPGETVEEWTINGEPAVLCLKRI
jgi:isoleucyl-tRNA synthetase